MFARAWQAGHIAHCGGNGKATDPNNQPSPGSKASELAGERHAARAELIAVADPPGQRRVRDIRSVVRRAAGAYAMRVRDNELTVQMSDPSIAGLKITRYKNLEDLWITGSTRTLVIGANGTGKTNLLEAFALLAGTPATRRRIQDRLATWQEMDVSLYVRESAGWLYAPAVCLQFALLRRGDDWRTIPGMKPLVADADWWWSLGATTQDSPLHVLLRAIPDPAVRVLMEPILQEALVSGVIRYRALGHPHKPTVQRSLCIPARSMPKGRKLGWTTDLPEVFAPFQAWFNASKRRGQGEYAPVLDLPGRGYPPVDFSWLPGERDGNALLDDLHVAAESVDRVLRSLTLDLVVALGISESHHQAIEDDTSADVLREVLQRTATEQLDLTMPHIEIDIEEVVPGHSIGLDWKPNADRARADIPNWTDQLKYNSAGERRWLDEAFAVATTALESYTQNLELTRALLGSIDSDRLLQSWSPAMVETATDFATKLVGDGAGSTGWLPFNVFDELITTARDRLLHEHTQESESFQDRVLKDVVYRRPERRLRVRAIDEPEAHLHPSTIRQIGKGLDRLASGGDLVLVTHHPYFIEQPGWQHIHLRRTPRGVAARKYRADQIEEVKKVASDLGVAPMELMSTLAGVLFVEGQHDRIILQAAISNELREAGVKVSLLNGIYNLRSLPDLELVTDLLSDLHVAIMVDNIWAEKSGEERVLFGLMESMREQNRPVTAIELHQPDIIAYLNEEAVRALYPSFPGWDPVVTEYRKTNPGDFKNWLNRTHNISLVKIHEIKRVLELMDQLGLHLEPGILHHVQAFCARCADMRNYPPFTNQVRSG